MNSPTHGGDPYFDNHAASRISCAVIVVPSRHARNGGLGLRPPPASPEPVGSSRSFALTLEPRLRRVRFEHGNAVDFGRTFNHDEEAPDRDVAPFVVMCREGPGSPDEGARPVNLRMTLIDFPLVGSCSEGLDQRHKGLVERNHRSDCYVCWCLPYTTVAIHTGINPATAPLGGRIARWVARYALT